MTEKVSPESLDHLDIYDRKIPISKRKVAFVRWLMRRGCNREKAKLICHYKFYHGEPSKKA